MHNLSKEVFFSIFLLFFSLSLNAQVWNQSFQFGNEGSDSIEDMEALPDGSVVAIGTFTESIQLGSFEFEALGRQDLWIAHFDALGNITWALQGGSTREDENSDLQIDPDGNIYWSGSFWGVGFFGDSTLTPPLSNKSLFLLKLTPFGEITQATTFHGSGAKEIGELAFDASSNIFLTGNYSDTLFQKNSFWTASQEGNIFAAKLNSNFEMEWLQTIESNGIVASKSLALLPQNELIISGDFQGTLFLNNDSIRTRTPDEDLFFIKFESDGTPIHLQRAGGVFPSLCKKVVADDDGNFHISGTHRGLIQTDSTFQIATNGQNDNFFILSFDQNFKTRWGKSFGSQETELLNDFSILNDQLFMAGSYEEAMMIDQTSIDIGDEFNNALFASFSAKTGDLNWVQTTSGSDLILGKVIAPFSENEIWVGGEFSDELNLNSAFNSNGFFDFFIGKIQITPSPVSSDFSKERFLIYPNPATETVWIESPTKDFTCSIYSALGQLMGRYESPTSIGLSDFPKGVYFVDFEDQRRLTQTAQLLIK